MYKSIKNYYDTNRYEKPEVKIFVQAKWITEEEYGLITGDNYQTGEPLAPPGGEGPETPVETTEEGTEATN